MNDPTVLSTPCIEWTGCCDRDGYGVRTINRRQVRVHRHAWIEANGEIADGLCVLHRCDNPPCINVEHLFLGSHGDNARDRKIKGRGSNPAGEASPRAKLTNEQVAAIRNDTRAQHVIAAEYGVAQSTICKIKLRHRYP